MVVDAGLTLAALGTVRLRRQYEAQGYCLSSPLIDLGTLARARAAVVAVMAAEYDTGLEPIYRNWHPGDPPQPLVKIDLPHLSSTDLQHLVADPRIGAWAASVLDAAFVQLRACELIYKFPERSPEPERRGFVGWHQDSSFWSHWVGEVFTLWLALVDTDERMGPVRYVAGSHRWGARDNARFFFDADLDAQRHIIGVPPGRAWRDVTATLSAGAASMHHRLTLHSSEPNRSDVPRVGLALHLRTERARLVPTPEPPFHTPDLRDTRACPVLFRVSPGRCGGVR
ncbi:MAG: phytanoyl-CoA dioxygenase family protein [Pseudonocardia sp.]